MAKTTKKELIKSHMVIGGRKFSATGKTVIEAILNLKPTVTRLAGSIVISKGKNKRERILNARTMYNIFGAVSGTQKEIAHKNVAILFDKTLFE